MLRRFAEVILGPVGVRRRLPSSVGSGVVWANARVGGLRYLFRASRDIDPVLLKVAASLVRPGDVVWDIGGNVGLFAAAASGLAGATGGVYTIEADRDAFALLCKTASAQGINHAAITPLNVAISNECGTANFEIAKRSRSANSLQGFGSTQTGGRLETRVVPTLTLDTLLKSFPPPQVLKIDVEGAEVLVLTGAERLLAEARPHVFVEVGTEVSREVAQLLRRHEYRIYDGGTFKELPTSQAAVWDTVAIPGELDFHLGAERHGQ